VILAAGSSSRLGAPKQLLVFNGQSFIVNTINIARAAMCYPIVVVVGSNYEKILPFIKELPIDIVYNNDWEKGMGTSIAKGISSINDREIDATLVMVCDQPFVTVEHINQLIDAYSHADVGIVATSYNNTIGVPVLFAKPYFASLGKLRGNEGAKKLVIDNIDHVYKVIFQKAVVDIDTQEDYQKLTE
jgi:molybdenum cofactor cytidylyltransferase